MTTTARWHSASRCPLLRRLASSDSASAAARTAADRARTELGPTRPVTGTETLGQPVATAAAAGVTRPGVVATARAVATGAGRRRGGTGALAPLRSTRARRATRRPAGPRRPTTVHTCIKPAHDVVVCMHAAPRVQLDHTAQPPSTSARLDPPVSYSMPR